MTTDPVAVLHALGGCAPYRVLVATTGRGRLRRAVRDGRVLALGRGRYALPTTREPLQVALADGGVLSHLSAAVHHGWAVTRGPAQVHVTVPRRAHRAPAGDLRRHYRDLGDHEVTGSVTTPVRTVLDCVLTLPVAEGLAVADSALRAGAVEVSELLAWSTGLRGPGSRVGRLVLAHADDRAANAFESTLRGHLLAAGIASFVPQLAVSGPGLFAMVDLGDPDARVALEADGHAVHGDRRRFAADLQRHDELQSAGWVTRRFAWEHVMRRPDWVVAQVRAALQQGRCHGSHRCGTRARMAAWGAGSGRGSASVAR